jgi:hypothetical protein
MKNMPIAEINNYHPKKIHAECKTTLLNTSNWRSITGVTLTTQLGCIVEGHWVPMNETQTRTAFKHFMDRVNRAVHGNANRQYNKRCRVFGVIEMHAVGKTDAKERWHIHAAIEPPIHISDAEFESSLRQVWRKIFGSYGILVLPNSGSLQMIGYMLKRRQKRMFEQAIDALDLDTYYNPLTNA